MDTLSGELQASTKRAFDQKKSG